MHDVFQNSVIFIVPGTQNGILFVPQSRTSVNSTPGPDFWSWTPPMDSEGKSDDAGNLQTARTSSPYLTPAESLMEKEQSVDFLSIPFESRFSESSHNPPLPPLQSLTEVGKVDVSSSSLEMPSLKKEDELGVLFLGHAAEAVHALDEVDGALSHGVSPDGSRWWRETGIEQRPDGVVCRWTLIRGVSADHVIEWEEKFWEAADKFQYKELGSEKSGRDATGNVWREYWKESMWQVSENCTFELYLFSCSFPFGCTIRKAKPKLDVSIHWLLDDHTLTSYCS